MSFNAPSDYYCSQQAPEELRDILSSNEWDMLREWCHKNPDMLKRAFDWVHPHHKDIRAIIQREIDELWAEEQREMNRGLHEAIRDLKNPHWTMTPVFWVTVGGALAASLAAWFGWLAVPRLKPPPVVAPPSSLSTPPPAGIPSQSKE